MTSETPQLSTLEWQAVSVALNDAAGCGCGVALRPGRLSRLFTALTGIEPRRPLADPRLETIRAFVCASRVRRPATDLVPTLQRHGFNERQIDALALLAA